MRINKKDIGYTLYSRLEEALRLFICDKLTSLYGAKWPKNVPDHIWVKAEERSLLGSRDGMDDPIKLLEEVDLPDLMEIICYQKSYLNFINNEILKRDDFRRIMSELYEIRIKIAHIKYSFSIADINYLIEISNRLLMFLNSYGQDLKEALVCIEKNPTEVIVKMPSEFIIYDDIQRYPTPNNLPPIDYEFEGGFIGRKNDLKKIEKYILGDLDRVITIAGAGGVGKTALAHQFCFNLLKKNKVLFDGIVWVSAKEEKLTATKIESIEPMFRNYDDLLDNILETFSWDEDLGKGTNLKEESVQTILQAGDRGILLVVDNLETINDQRIIEFIKDIPRPSKVLITSRIGLGEIERRYTLKEMSQNDAITLLRTVAKEKDASNLVHLSDKLLFKYVEKMSRYPLAIKWVVGQVALGKSIDQAIGGLTSSEGNVSKFLFEHIFNNLLEEKDRITLFSLAAYEKPITQGVMMHVANLSSEELDRSIKNLTIASLIICTHESTEEEKIETKYELIPLIRNFVKTNLQNNKKVYRAVLSRIETVEHLMEEAERAKRIDRHSLIDMGAKTEEEKIAMQYSNVAYQKHQRGDLDGATSLFEKAANIAPDFPPIYRNWAIVAANVDSYEQAEELMKKSISLNPKDATTWFVWGNMNKQRNRLDKAFIYLKKSLDLSPNDAKILGALGSVEIRRGNFENAEILLHQALEGKFYEGKRKHEIVCNTTISQNYRRWAEYLIKDKRRDEAIEKFKKAFDYGLKASELGRDDFRAQDNFRKVCMDFGICLLFKEGIKKSLPYLQKAILKNPKNIKEKRYTERVCYYLSRAYLRENNIDEAKRYFTIGNNALYPGSKFYQKFKLLKDEIYQERYSGNLYRVVPGKGYGFIERNDQEGIPIFIHYTDIIPSLTLQEFENHEGKNFIFSVRKTKKGYNAFNVKLNHKEVN
jgi:tetratricopeptide (TPR) repeat protein